MSDQNKTENTKASKSFFPNVTIEVAEKSDWITIINQQEFSHGVDLYDIFKKESIKVKKENLEFYQFLSHIFSLYFDENNPPNEPYVAMINFKEGRTAIITDFTEQHLKVIESLIGKSNIPFADARFADILWLRRKKIKFAKIAIDNFVAHAEKLLKSQDKVYRCDGREAFERACQIWSQIGQPEKQYKPLIESIKDKIDFNKEEPQDYSRIHFLQIFAKYNHLIKNPKEWIKQCETLSSQMLAVNHSPKAEEYLKIAINIAEKTKDKEYLKKLRKKYVDIYIDLVRMFKRENAEPIFLSSWYMKAIAVCREYNQRYNNELKKIIDELQIEMQEVQSNIKLKESSFSIDMAPIIKPIEKIIKDAQNDQELINAIAAMAKPQKKDSIHKQVMERKTPFLHLIPQINVDDQGHVVANKPSIIDSDGLNKEAIESEMVRACNDYIEIIGIAIGKTRITLERRLPSNSNIFENLVKENPFVPKERKNIFIKALNAGLKGDHLTCVHLLIPQIENSIRMILEQKGGILVTKLREQKKQKKENKKDKVWNPDNLTQDLTQEQFDLDKTLRLDETKEIFGEDMVFHLRSLLVNRFGGNYRNKLAHGLLKDNDFLAGWPNYLWAITIRLCFIGQLLQQQKSKKHC